MTRSRLVLLDTNVVLHLFEMGLWPQVTQRYQVVLAQSVVDEARYIVREGHREEIDWSPMIAAKQVEVRSISVTEVRAYCNRFDPNYFEKLHPGESESLALLAAEPAASICSADKIVWRVLGNTNQGDRGVSLEELLQKMGLTRHLDRRFCKSFREQWTRGGGKDHFMGLGDRG